MAKTMADVKAANEAAGYNWFSRDTMKFWKTRIESSLIGGRWFISSEDEWCFDGRTPARVYCVREAMEDGSIHTVQSHIRSKEGAKDIIASLKVKAHLPNPQGVGVFA